MPCMKCANGKQMGYGCSTKGYKCTFFIGNERFNEVVNSLYSSNSKIISEEDNLSELNNL